MIIAVKNNQVKAWFEVYFNLIPGEVPIVFCFILLFLLSTFPLAVMCQN